MKPINLYLLARSTPQCFSAYYRILSQVDTKKKFNSREADSIRIFIDVLKLKPELLDGFYLSYSIPQIGKEFDLLKLGKDRILNIELKSEFTSVKKIREQLQKNRDYLKTLDCELFLFTVVTDTLTVYQLDEQGKLVLGDLKDIIEIITLLAKQAYREDIDALFDPARFLISPVQDPERFVNKDYYLTQHQQYIEKKILKSKEQIFSIKGLAGTGKTLLLYDLASKFARKGKTIVLHCAHLNEKLKTLNTLQKGFEVVSINENIDSTCQYLLVDEAQRLSRDNLNSLMKLKAVKVFCYDDSYTENSCIGPYIANHVQTENCFELTNHIRSNKALVEVTKALFEEKYHIKYAQSKYNINISYSQNMSETQELIAYYQEKNYIYLPVLEKEYSIEDMLGIEYDNVLVVLRNEFYYDKDHKLVSYEDSNLQKLYLAVTRGRKKISLIIENNADLYEKMMNIYA